MTTTSDVIGVGATRVAGRNETTSPARDWERYAWAAGIIYVIALSRNLWSRSESD